ncbi:MAG: PIG-L family deacetylase [Kiritimatiellales bacterium]|nr:PIG-L family deacetylase [Kiritimatiellales bacterium]
MNPYFDFVKSIQDGVARAKGLTAVGTTAPIQSDQKILLFSPHPDDECITGLLPLRLMREAGMQVINVPVTFGSNVERQPGRATELKNACNYLGWNILKRTGFQNLGKTDVVEILKAEQPDVIVIPHSKDWNSRHIATHFLVMEALADMPADFSCTVVETEFWGAMDNPNLMVEGDTQTVADLVAALSLHTKEVERNPYHLSLPAWMQDNVRRGGELVGGQGGAAPSFAFAALYRLSKWRNGKLFQGLEKNRMLAMGNNLKEII